MQHMLSRVEMQDYEAWLRTHQSHSEDRRRYGITDGPIYRDINNPNAVLVHIMFEDLDRAMQWFASDTFKEATKHSTATGREHYLAQKR
jgi:heme-degrading monooxygenase HmoA